MDELEKYLETNNWFNFSKFLDLVAAREGFLRFAEVGVWKGHSLCYLGKKLVEKSIPFEFYAIDTWDKDGKYPTSVTQFEKENIQAIFHENLKRAGLLDYITVLKTDSISAANKFKAKYFDYVLVDANHDEDAAEADIKAWWPKVRKGGMLACHDYVPHCGVWPAVNKLLQNRTIVGNDEVLNDMFYIVKCK